MSQADDPLGDNALARIGSLSLIGYGRDASTCRLRAASGRPNRQAFTGKLSTDWLDRHETHRGHVEKGLMPNRDAQSADPSVLDA